MSTHVERLLAALLGFSFVGLVATAGIVPALLAALGGLGTYALVAVRQRARQDRVSGQFAEEDADRERHRTRERHRSRDRSRRAA